jgi:hypothetical protein
MNDFAQARDQCIIQIFAESCTYPRGFRLEQGAAQGDILMKLVANAQIFGGGFNGCLIDNPVSLQGMDVTRLNSGALLHDRQE